MFALLLALATGPAAPAAPVEPAWVVTGAAGEPATGPLVRLTTDLTATLGSRTGAVSVRDVIALRRANRPLPPFPTGPQLITASGERIAGDLARGGGPALAFAPTLVPLKRDEAWRVPLGAGAAVWLTDLPADTPADPSRYTWVEGVRNRDVLRFRNGDIARGVVTAFGAEAAPGLRFRPESGEARAVPVRELAAVVFNPLLVKARKPKGPYARIVLADGSRFDASNVTIADKALKGDAAFGHPVEVPLDAVVALTVLQGKATYLSDVKPKKVDQAGFLGAAWPVAIDRSVSGTPIALTGLRGDSTFDKGLGTHPRTVLTYDLGGKYQRFESLVGLDPVAGNIGQVAVRVRVDGKEQPLPRLGALRAGPPVAVRISVADAKELVLEVDFGPAGGVAGGVNWAEARLVE